MPYVTIKITREGTTTQQKNALIQGVTDLLVTVLNKNPATTFVVIDEVATEDWGIGGMPVHEFRKHVQESAEPTTLSDTSTAISSTPLTNTLTGVATVSSVCATIRLGLPLQPM